VTLGLATIAALLAVWAFVTGGFRVNVFGIPLSARGGHRAALFAVVLGVIGFVLLDRERRMMARCQPVLPAIPLAAAAAVLSLGIAFGARAAGGSDTYGYVSQARLWLAGNLRVTRTDLRQVPWPDGDWTFMPLGYREAGPQTIVPTYPPGLPLLMATAEMAWGSCGPFFVNPICAALLVWFTYALGARVSGRGVGALACLCTATSPLVLMFTVSPLSDVPAATFWTASLVLACSRGNAAAAASGGAAGLAILIRPNLAPLALVPMLLAVSFRLRSARTNTDTRFRSAAAAAVMFAVTCAPAVVFVGWLFDSLYGSPLVSGYGPTSGMYAWKHLPTNIAQFPKRLLDTQGPIPFLSLLAPFLAARPRAGDPYVRWFLLAFIVAVLGAYAFYLPFEEWWYLRFLLPMFPALFVLTFDVIKWCSDRNLGVAVLLTSIALYQGAAFTVERDIIRAAEEEHRYADAGRFVAGNLPPHSVVLAFQHSGAVRLYSAHLTLRYDLLDPEWLDRALDHLRREGHEPYLLLEDWEVERFRERFAGQQSAALVDLPPLAAMPDRKVLLFAGDPSQRGPGTAIMPRTHGCRTAW
jgi:hypothetical protein